MGIKQEVYEWVQNEETISLQTSALCTPPNSSEDTHELNALYFHYISIKKKQNMLITLAYLRNKH